VVAGKIDRLSERSVWRLFGVDRFFLYRILGLRQEEETAVTQRIIGITEMVADGPQ